MLQAQVNSRNIKRKLARGFAAFGMLVFALLFVAGAFAFALAALWIYLRPALGPVYASLVLAGLHLILAMSLLIVASRMTKGRNRRQHGKNMPDVGVADVEKSIRANKPLLLTAALLAGILAASAGGARRAP